VQRCLVAHSAMVPPPFVRLAACRCWCSSTSRSTSGSAFQVSAIASRLSTSSYLDAAQRAQSWPAVSRAPQADIERWKARMGWEEIPWYTLIDDFDADFDVGEWHGTNAFLRAGDEIFRTYYVDKRGDEVMGGTWSYLDITALGRQEIWEDSPEGYPQTQAYVWWSRHDEYDDGAGFDHALSDETASQRG
jgi:predicted dithiol-disulfide oxidoreductase (DUF899 family)